MNESLDEYINRWENERSKTPIQYLRRFGFWKIHCLCFEFQFPSFIWNNIVLGSLAYKIHGFFCIDYWKCKLRIE